ncbi:MAG: single-stranded DNA-binding protein [Lachnospiraceae bacterium]|nr:single-stranded DNA-binding protein [Lachnospiraceae bacterium]
MNKIILMGRLTRDPEMRTSGGNGTAVCRYSLAVDRRFKRDGEPDADFFNCTVFGKGAEFAERYFRQGTKILITGRIQSDNYTNRDGQKVYSWQVIVDEQEFAESKNAASAGSDSAQPKSDAANAGNGFVDIKDGIEEELPFL